MLWVVCNLVIISTVICSENELINWIVSELKSESSLLSNSTQLSFNSHRRQSLRPVPNEILYCDVILSDNYHLLLLAPSTPCLWAVGWMGCVNTVSEWTGSGNLRLPDKVMIVYWKGLQTCVLCDSWKMNVWVVRFDILMAVSIRIMIWVVTPYTLVGHYWCLSHIYQST
jgi:hypothetical protein